jgi:hypothetical protein
MSDDVEVLTNTAAAARLRTLLHQIVQDEPPLSLRLVHNLTPTPEEHVLLSSPTPEEKP